MELKNLNAKQLRNVISKANEELNRREKVQRATAEIQMIIRKYGLSPAETKTALFHSLRSKSRSVTKPKPKPTRSKVAPKYRSEDGINKWTGRGRSPGWVIAICSREGISVESFKADPRFLI